MRVTIVSLVSAFGTSKALIVNPRVSSDAVYVIPGTPSSNTSAVQFQSTGSQLDAPKLSPINRTVFDWWYWDAVADDLSASVVLTVFTAEPSGLWTGIPITGSTTWLGAAFTFANGTPWTVSLPGDSLVVKTAGDGSSGSFNGMNVTWAGSSDMSEYVISIDEPSAGIQGTFTLASAAPAHLPCSASIQDPQSLELSPDFGWANAVPDGESEVDFTLGDTKLRFSGPGYHDKNWGCKPVNVTLQSWYWGHARVGPYSIVWFTVVALDGSEYLSSYASNHGKVITSQCGGITVRPTGTNVTYPPTPESAPPTGFRVEQEIEGKGTLVLEATNERVITLVDNTAYRWIGRVSAGFGNETQWEGVGLYEQFAFNV